MPSSPRIDELKKKFDENPRRYFAPLANEYRKFGDLEQAIQLCRAYLPQQPGHMSGHIVFGQALFEAGNLEEARGVFEAALALDPENLIALRHLGDIARTGGDTSGARQWYQRVLDADPRNEEMAAQIATIDAAPPVAPASAAAPTAGDRSAVAGWADINPEAAKAATAAAPGGAPAGAAPAASAPKATAPAVAGPDIVDLSSLELRDSLSMPVVRPSVPPPAASAPPSAKAAINSALTEPEFERDGEGAFAPPSVDAATRPPIGVERSEEVDLQAPASDQPSSAYVGGSAEAIPPAPEIKAPTAKRDIQSFGPPNEFGFEVMEFVPPPRESDPEPVHDQPGRGGFGVPFTGETNAKDETPAAFVTETMAELYLQQGFTQEALAVYRQLLAQNPRDNGLRDRIAALEKGSRSSVGMAAVSDKVYDEVQRRHAREPETIRAFFGALMRRRVLQRYDDSARAGHTRPEARAPNGAATAWVAETPSRVEQSREGYGSFTAAESEHDSSETAFIVPEGAAPPPGMAPGDEQRAEYRDDVQASAPSEQTERAPIRLEAAPAAEPRHSSPAPYVAPPTDYAAPAPYESKAAERPDSRHDYAASIPAAPAETAPAHVAPAADETGNISSLFGGAGVESFDEQAARVLSGAFPVVEGRSLAGRPAERAKNELSLDNVFREADRKTGRNSGGFSFDQFFSDGSGGAKPASRSTDPSGTTVGGPDLAPDDDVAQFNDWLSGLKKK
jgi:tetratricopeptide (TPR) repeat protein